MKTRIMSGLRTTAMLAALSCGAGSFAAVTNVWTGASSGTWTDPANWDTHAVPAADDIAVFTGAQMTRLFIRTACSAPAGTVWTRARALWTR